MYAECRTEITDHITELTNLFTSIVHDILKVMTHYGWTQTTLRVSNMTYIHYNCT